MNTLRYALRFLLRARTYTLINLLGLAFSLACCIILLRYIHRELTVDTHCVDRENVYAVQVSLSGGVYWGSYAAYRNDSVLIAPELIETKCSFVPLENDFLVSEGHRYRCDVLATDSTFFQLFSYPLIQGEKNLTDPSSVVLTQSYAQEVFGSLDAMKVLSCMTLFNEVASDDLFQQVIDRYYQGKVDETTKRKLE